MPQRNIDEREERKQYIRRRQIIVFSIVAAAMVVAMVLSLLSWFHVFNRSSAATPEEQAQENFGAISVCAPPNSGEGAATYSSNSDVYLRVLNGTASHGFAGAVGDALKDRLFNVTSVSNYTRQDVKRTTIYYGANNIHQAYTVRANFTDAKMVMDNRGDTLVDVVLGSSFEDLVPKKQVPVKGSKIKNLTGCVSTSKIDNTKGTLDGKKLPAADAHDAPPAVPAQ